MLRRKYIVKNRMMSRTRISMGMMISMIGRALGPGAAAHPLRVVAAVEAAAAAAGLALLLGCMIRGRAVSFAFGFGSRLGRF